MPKNSCSALVAQSPRSRCNNRNNGFGSNIIGSKKGFACKQNKPTEEQRAVEKEDSTASNHSIAIKVLPSASQKDFIALADLRYQEWMMKEPPETRPSLHAFRMATAEIQQERMEGRAVSFLACLPTTNNVLEPLASRSGSFDVVGAAELSPVEFQGCFDEKWCNNVHDDNRFTIPNTFNQYQYWYVTDVVTASTHRRKGIAAELMQTLERHALCSLTHQKAPFPVSETVLLMHVEPENVGALAFYQHLGYNILREPRTDVDNLAGLDVEELAKNAGVEGQLLLGKKLSRLTE